MVNVAVLRKELEFLTAHPEEHKQQVWLESAAWTPTQLLIGCGTVGCLAGNAVLHADRVCAKTTVYWDFGAERWLPSYTTYWPHGYMSGTSEVFLGWQKVGAEVLGLTPSQAAMLFHEGNSIAKLWRLANAMTSGDVVPRR